MSLIDRYLAAVRRNLPADKAEDITAELADELAMRHDDREEVLGRDLTRDETIALLRDHGHPLAVAARYRPHQYLIGPDVFPFYLYTLKVVLTVGAALLLTLTVVSTMFGDGNVIGMFTRATDHLWGFFLSAVAVVTLGFAGYERWGNPADLVRRWTPDNLPDVVDRPPSQWESALEVGLGIAFLLWWTGVLPLTVFAEQQGIRITAAPVWAHYYLPILILAAAQLAVHVVKWLRPRWKLLTGGATIALSLATLAVIVGVYQAGEWAIVTASGMDAEQSAGITDSVNLALSIALIVIALVMIAQVLGELWKLARGRRAAV